MDQTQSHTLRTKILISILDAKTQHSELQKSPTKNIISLSHPHHHTTTPRPLHPRALTPTRTLTHPALTPTRTHPQPHTRAHTHYLWNAQNVACTVLYRPSAACQRLKSQSESAKGNNAAATPNVFMHNHSTAKARHDTQAEQPGNQLNPDCLSRKFRDLACH